jgi:hydrogenase expression/formation protein HypD
MEALKELRNPELLRRLAHELRATAAPPAALMEVCGTHTVAIARHGLRQALPEGVRLISGPGCPVCVTPQQQIDHFIALGRLDRVTLTTFGDMLRVPGSDRSLEQARAEGVDARIVYSPMDAVALAARLPERDIVFFGIGFETTAPAVALAITEAKRQRLPNFSVLCAHKLIPPAMLALLDSEVKVDGFICPGHVSVIIGSDAYRPVARRGKPCVVTGFEPADILRAIQLLLRQLAQGRADVESEYARAVRPEGNRRAQELLSQVFHVTNARWRGLGEIAHSGLAIAGEFAAFDAAVRFQVNVPPAKEPLGCRCGDVLRGLIDPPECPLFGAGCTPAAPVGSCMVSTEGACQAHYRYRGAAPVRQELAPDPLPPVRQELAPDPGPETRP